jgi:hypothetical protein
MTAHDTILLEEPPDKRFEPMLDEKFAIDDYLEDQELEYPEFRRQMPIDSPCVIRCGPRRWWPWFSIRARPTSKPGKFIVPSGTNSGGGCRPVSPLRVNFLMTGVVRQLGYRRHLFGPGDLLTLYYRFHPRGRFPAVNLFAARALVYNKLILKEEIAADADTYPHTRDELEVGSVTDRLSMNDCQRLYQRVRRASTTESREILMRYLGSSWDGG